MSSFPLLGLLILDREPFAPVHFLGLLQAWLQDAGGFAALGLVVYIAYALRMPAEQAESAKYRAGVNTWMLLMAVAAILCYAGYFALVLTGKGIDTVNQIQFVSGPGRYVKYEPPKFSTDLQPLLLTFGGLFALLGIGQPFVASLGKIRFRRIWALSKLGFKEAVRSKLFWVFLVFLIPLLFPTSWFFPVKAENQLRTTIGVTSFVSTVLLLLPAALLASFSIPNDIKNQNIYTIITKPVERFEIVLGRFFGYGFLMTLALIGMTLVGWFFIVSARIDDKAAGETYMARDPIRGELKFRSRREIRGEVFEGTNVGREFDYRKYIAGDPASSQRAVWNYYAVPSELGKNDNKSVSCEFTFDIFRMTKGEENRGVDMTIRAVTWKNPQAPPREEGDGNWRWDDPAKQREYEEDLRNAVEEAGFTGQNPAAVVATARPGTPAWDIVNKLAAKYGYYEFAGKEVFDYHPEQIDIPAGIFENARDGYPPTVGANEKPPPMVSVFVNCTSRGQMVGMAEGDLYFLSAKPTPSASAFASNYFKASFGLWCRVMLVIGLAVACSTYFAGVIAFLITAALFIGGYFSEHIADVAQGSYIGGPFKAINQLLEAKAPTAQVGDSPVEQAAAIFDTGFSWLVRRVINLVPDIDAFNWSTFLSEGFNIPFAFLFMNLVVLIGYLLPWFILAFYLMRSREVAE